MIYVHICCFGYSYLKKLEKMYFTISDVHMNRQIILNKRISLRIMPQFKVFRSDNSTYETLHEKCPNTEIFLVQIQGNMDQKKLRI